MQWTELGNLGVVIFVLITGYFSITSKFKLHKLIKLEIQVLTYSLIFLILFSIFSPESLTLKTVIKSIFPFLFDANWFFTCYIVLYMLTPFINKLLNKLNKKEYLTFLTLMFFIWTLIPTLTSLSPYLNPLWEFFYYYSIGAYLRNFPMSKKNEKKLAITLTVSGMGLMLLSSVVFDVLAVYVNPLFIMACNDFYRRNTLLTLAAAIGFFLIFKNWDIGMNKTINKIAALTFGIYLIHDNKQIRPLLWNYIFVNAAYETSPFLIIHMIFSVISVFIVCGLIEFVRQVLLEKPLDKKLKSGCDKLSAKACNTLNKLYSKFDKAFYSNIKD